MKPTEAKIVIAALRRLFIIHRKTQIVFRSSPWYLRRTSTPTTPHIAVIMVDAIRHIQEATDTVENIPSPTVTTTMIRINVSR